MVDSNTARAWSLVLRRQAVRLLTWLTIVAACTPGSLAQDAAAVVAALEEVTVSAIAKAERSVVAIARVPRQRNANDRAQSSVLDLGLTLNLENPLSNPDFVPTFFGSGVVISDDGAIVTCGHVLGDPRENDYYVWLDRKSYAARVVSIPAKVLASDPFSDLAVLQISDQDSVPIEFGQAEDLRKGQFVIALGNPDAIARDGQASASWGMISNLNRFAPSAAGDSSVAKETIHEYGTLIQTDAKLNFGTSGGALIDLDGRLIGLTTSLAPRVGSESPAGFAIAVDELFRRVVQQLKLGKLPEFGFLGIQPENLRNSEKRRGVYGARVNAVMPGLPGDNAGLRPRDVIVQVGEQPIQDRNDLFRELSRAAAGESVELLVQRRRNDFGPSSLVKLTAELSKKLVQTSHPSYAINESRSWRGLRVEYSTAIAAELLQAGIWRSARNTTRLSISNVEPDSPAWNAGLRPGNGVRSVAGKPVDDPDNFYETVDAMHGPVILEIIPPNGLTRKVAVTTERKFD